MAPSPKLKRDYIYYGFFSLHLASILLVDLVPLYPESYWANPKSIFRFLLWIREYYIATFNDPFFKVAHDTLPPWYKLFTYLEIAIQIPMSFWIRAQCGDSKEGTTPGFELASVAYGVQVALTTLVCVWDVAYWDPVEYSVQDKSMFVFGLYGPFVLIPLIFSVDMGRRLLGRIEAAEATTEVAKKTQ
ncbi:transmembrane protein 6/97 [Plectosphaerella plurivora]|uniref:Efficient mitochondria targeting-associated protein 19 n=1 Tax=Plectosphaerella plurivora TaxID=936078 RepID=A0A9P9AAZ5_9PEZI|nr:transmembrane protein 6/97 [Plectosphaerella plurivora]